MSDDYMNWIEQTVVAQETSDYIEPSLDELVQMMDAIPLQGDEWIQSPQTLVAPLSLEQFWDCYWTNDAPYYLEAIMVDPEDLLLLSTNWRRPSEGQTVLIGKPVIQERIFEKDKRARIAFAPDFVNYYARFSLVERNETYMQVFEQHITTGAPYTDTFHYNAIWEAMTPDPRSNQVVFRKSFRIRWFEKPLIW